MATTGADTTATILTIAKELHTHIVEIDEAALLNLQSIMARYSKANVAEALFTEVPVKGSGKTPILAAFRKAIFPGSYSTQTGGARECYALERIVDFFTSNPQLLTIYGIDIINNLLFLTEASSERINKSIKHLLDAYPNLLEATDDKSNNLLHLFCKSGRIDRSLLEEVVRKKSDLLSQTNSQGKTPLHLSLEFDGYSGSQITKRTQLIMFLVENIDGEFLSLQDQDGNTFLHLLFSKKFDWLSPLIKTDGGKELALLLISKLSPEQLNLANKAGETSATILFGNLGRNFQKEIFEALSQKAKVINCCGLTLGFDDPEIEIEEDEILVEEESLITILGHGESMDSDWSLDRRYSAIGAAIPEETIILAFGLKGFPRKVDEKFRTPSSKVITELTEENWATLTEEQKRQVKFILNRTVPCNDFTQEMLDQAKSFVDMHSSAIDLVEEDGGGAGTSVETMQQITYEWRSRSEAAGGGASAAAGARMSFKDL